MKFLIKLGDCGGDILKKLHTVYGDEATKATVVYKWVARYKEGQESLEDDPHSGRPISAHNNENMKRVDELLTTNRRILNRNIAETLGINREIVRLIIAEDFCMQRLCSYTESIPIAFKQ